MLSTLTTHTTGVNWSAVAAITTPTLFVIGAVGKALARKLDALGEHLKAQDRAKGFLSQRIARIEGKLGMVPYKEEDDDER